MLHNNNIIIMGSFNSIFILYIYIYIYIYIYLGVIIMLHVRNIYYIILLYNHLIQLTCLGIIIIF